MKNISLLLVCVLASLPHFSKAEECGPDKTVPFKDEMEITEWIEKEKNIVSSPEHASQMFVHRNEVGNILKTPISVVVIHGLYNSPLWTKDLSEKLYNKGFNVLNVRLPGHFEANKPRALDRVSARDWEKSVEADFNRAQLLGDKVLLVGHSLGGLLGTRLAIKYTDNMAGLVLLAPAFQSSFSAFVKSTLTALLGYHQSANKQSIQERYVSGKPAVKTLKLFKKLYKQGHDVNPKDPIEGLADLLTNVPTLVINTAIEKAMDMPKVLNTTAVMKLRSKTPKFNLMLDRELNVPHREIATPSEMNKGYDLITNAINEFLAYL